MLTNVCCLTLGARLRKLGGLMIAALICGLPGAWAADFTFANFTSVAGLNLVGNAAQSGSVLRVTPATFGQAGAAWFTTKEPVGSGFTTTFQFQITPTKACEGDGFAFVIQNTSVSAIGAGGGSIGYGGSGGPGGIPNSLAVEFDTFFNATLGDPNGNHVSVHTLGTGANSANESASLGNTGTGLAVNLLDHLVHTARVTYTPGAPGSMSVFIDNLTTPVLTVAANIPSTLALAADGTAFIGFTSGTGACADNHDILSWSFSAPCPAHAHAHVDTLSPGHLGAISNPHTHHAQHGHNLIPETCPPHAPGHTPGLTADSGEGLFAASPPAAQDPEFVAVLNEDGDSGPARAGSVLQLYGSAAGLFVGESDDVEARGFKPPASGSPLYYTTSLPEVRLGGLPAKVLFSGLAPGLTGTWQINVVVPEGVRRGRVPVSILYDGQPVTSIDVAVK